MAYAVTEPCIGVKDGACVEVCPVEAFIDIPGEAQMYIDPDLCLDCGACVVACPVDAIFADCDVPEKWQHFIELNAVKVTAAARGG